MAESAIDPERSDAEGAALIRTSSALHRAFRSALKRQLTCAALCAGPVDLLERRRQRVRGLEEPSPGARVSTAWLLSPAPRLAASGEIQLAMAPQPPSRTSAYYLKKTGF